MAIIASAAQPKLRGTFMSLNGTVQSLAMGLATTLAGFLITLDASGRIVGYPLVGYVAVSEGWRWAWIGAAAAALVGAAVIVSARGRLLRVAG